MGKGSLQHLFDNVGLGTVVAAPWVTRLLERSGSFSHRMQMSFAIEQHRPYLFA